MELHEFTNTVRRDGTGKRRGLWEDNLGYIVLGRPELHVRPCLREEEKKNLLRFSLQAEI